MFDADWEETEGETDALILEQKRKRKPLLIMQNNTPIITAMDLTWRNERLTSQRVKHIFLSVEPGLRDNQT